MSAGEQSAHTHAGGTRPRPALAVRDLVRRHGTRTAVDRLQLELGAGESAMLLGPNGAGKSTLLQLCAGLLRPDAGEVRVLGADPRKAATRLAIGLVPQALAIYPRLTVRENLDFFARLHQVDAAARPGRTDEAIRLASLEARADEAAGRLSGGMQRRLNFACALLHRPTVLLLDEPTVGVDPQSRQVLYEAMSSLRAEGVTMLCATHLFDEAERFGERVIVIRDGRICADGTADALKRDHGVDDLHTMVLRLTGTEDRA